MAEISCRCGKVRGRVADVSPSTVNRVVCYCDDCQAFAHHLGRADLLNAQGGSDIVQVAPATMALVQGQELVAGLRLTPKGLYRWYATCCQTPLGNTVSPAIPFVGVIVQAFKNDGQAPDQVFGPPIGAIKGEYAIGPTPPNTKGIGLGLMMRSIAKVLGWRLRGKTWPHPYFDHSTRQPVYPVTVLTPEQRQALRSKCGPRPSASS